MKMTIVPKDSYGSFHTFYERIHEVFPGKKQRETKAGIDVYWNAIKNIWTNFDEKIIREMEKEIVLKLEWFPTPSVLYNISQRYITKYKSNDFESGKPKQQISKQVLNMPACVPLDKAKAWLHKVLVKDHNVVNASEIVDELEIALDYFTENDFKEIRSRLLIKKQPIPTREVVNTIFEVRREFVFPRWEEIDLYSLDNFPWQNHPSTEKVDKYLSFQRKLWSNALVRIRFKNEDNSNPI